MTRTWTWPEPHDSITGVAALPFDLLATCWTTAGDAVPLPGRHVSPLGLRYRIESAQRAGFTSFGILDHDLRRYLDSGDLPTLAALLRDHGMAYVELEFLTRWWTTGAEREASDESRRLLLTAAEALGAHHIKAAPDVDEQSPPDFDTWAAAFHDLAAEAAEHGTTVALEFMPFANVSTLDAAVEIATRAGHPAGGVAIDMWHVQRSGLDLASLAQVPIDLVLAVELDDGSNDPVGDPYDDTVLRRLLPGDGDFPLVEFASTLMAAGWRLPWGVEILSADYRVRPLEESLPEVVDKTIAVLDLAQERTRHADGT